MSSPLHKAPSGLLELFDLKTLGRQPFEFADIVDPSVDVFEFYAANVLFTNQTTLAATGFPLSLTFPVSYTRRWRAVGGQITLGANAGTYLRARIGVRVPTAANPFITLAEAQWAAPFLVAGQFYDVTYSFPVPAILPAGSEFAILVFSDATGADHVLTAKSLADNLATP